MKILLTTIFFASTVLAIGQFNGLLRTDGVYIYDNGLDTIIEAKGYAKTLADEYNQSRNVSHIANPCGQNNLVTMDGSVFLSMLVFYPSGSGRRANLGACRDEQHFRDNALLAMQRELAHDSSYLSVNQQLQRIVISEDSTLSFYYSNDQYLKEIYVGKSFGDSLVLDVKRAMSPESDLFNGHRTYRFFTYNELFDCVFNYSKP